MTHILEVLGRSAGGIARHVARVVTELDGRDGLVVDVAAPDGLPVAMPKPPRRITIPTGVVGHRKAINDLRGHLRAGNYRVVHAHGLRAGIDTALAARALEVPTVVTVHNLVREEVRGAMRASLLRWSEPLVVRLATHVFAVSEEIAARLRSSAPGHAHKVEVLSLGVGMPVVRGDPSAVRAALGVRKDEALIVTAARLRPQKALDVMVRAIARLPPHVFLGVVGEGPEAASLRALAQELGVAERVRFMGWRDDALDFIAAGDVFCLSSAWEGVPLAAQEAILLGVPVVATDVGGMKELVRDGESGRLVAPGDPDALARALAQVLESRELRTSFAQRARQELGGRFSTARMVQRLHEVYRALATP